MIVSFLFICRYFFFVPCHLIYIFSCLSVLFPHYFPTFSHTQRCFASFRSRLSACFDYVDGCPLYLFSCDHILSDRWRFSHGRSHQFRKSQCQKLRPFPSSMPPLSTQAPQMRRPDPGLRTLPGHQQRMPIHSKPARLQRPLEKATCQPDDPGADSRRFGSFVRPYLCRDARSSAELESAE